MRYSISHYDEDGRWYLADARCSTQQKHEAKTFTRAEAEIEAQLLKNHPDLTPHSSIQIVEASSPLGAVVGALLRAWNELENDAISESYGVHPPIDGAMRRVAASHGWTLDGIVEALERRGVSKRWTYFSGLGSILPEPEVEAEYYDADCPTCGAGPEEHCDCDKPSSRLVTLDADEE